MARSRNDIRQPDGGTPLVARGASRSRPVDTGGSPHGTHSVHRPAPQDGHDTPAHGAGAARAAVDELITAIYGELRRIAHHQLRRERPGHTLNTTALVNETYVKLAGLRQIVWRDRAHFLSIAARAMRRVLVDYAVARRTQKRSGGGRLLLDLDALGVDPRVDELIAIERAMRRLEQYSPRLVRVVECRFFAGMSIEETASALALSSATVKRDWLVARAWLNRELAEE